MNIERCRPEGSPADQVFTIGQRVEVNPTGRKRKPLRGVVDRIDTSILPIRVRIDGCGAAPCYKPEHLRPERGC